MASLGEKVTENLANEQPIETVDESVQSATPETTPEPAPRRQRRKIPEPVSESAPSGTETPEASDAPTPEPKQAPAWLQRVKEEFEFDVADDEDPDAVLSRVLDYTSQQRKDAEALEAWRRQNESFVAYGQQYLAQQKPQQAEQPKSEQPKPWDTPVKYSDNFSEYRERDEDGTEQWKANTPAEVRAQGDAWLNHVQQHVRMVANRPDLFWQKVREVAQSVSREEVVPFYEQKTVEQQRVEQERQFAQQNAAWLYARDPRTNQPLTGQFSEIGNLFVNTYQEFLDKGHPPQDAIELAQYRVSKRTGSEPWKPVEKTPEQIREEKRSEHVRKPANGAKAIANRSGSFTEGSPQNAQQGLGRSILNRMNQLGVSPPA